MESWHKNCNNHKSFSSKCEIFKKHKQGKQQSGTGQSPACRWNFLKKWTKVAYELREISEQVFSLSLKFAWNKFAVDVPISRFVFKIYNNRFSSSSFLLPGNVDDASTSEANIKEEPVDPIELRRLQQLTSNGNFLNGNYQFPNVNGNNTTFTPLTPASVLHHQPHAPGLKCRHSKPFLFL